MAGFRGSPAPSSRRPVKAVAEAARVVVPFEDNRVLTQLLGEYDSHLALIEDRLGINAHAHGNVIILTGPAQACVM
ncbi:MAG TPA: phosphate starvation-inducible protein PhoH, partial [Hyphomicrobium sp.]|nr:phosphate starvation-inducible protein PhoH [Hyphomicrobium sp.]